MTKSVVFKGKHIQFYECNDCGMLYTDKCGLRPNNKFCDPKCRAYVEANNLQKSNEYRRIRMGENDE